MYIITNSSHKITDISILSQYVKRLSNGTVIFCPKEESTHIYSNGSNSFFLRESEEIGGDSHELHEVEEIPVGVVAGYYYFNENDGSFYSTEEDLTALAKSTMLENTPEAVLELADGQLQITEAVLELADIVLGG